MPSNAEAFFAEIFNQDDPFSFLVNLTKSEPPTTETEWLEFKGSPQPQDILKKWSEAISGFANTEGGVLIWGIDCRKNEKGVDAACGISLIANPVALKSLLLTNINQTTDPPVQGIVLREIVGDEGRGFLVCLIPESSNKPHRSEQKTYKPYMIRVGDSFAVPSPSLLRSMFYPRVSPDCRVEIRSISEPKLPGSTMSSRASFKFQGFLSNVGKSTAHDLFVEVTSASTGQLEPGSYGWRKAETTRGSTGLEYLRTLHPNMITSCFIFEAQVSFTDRLKPPSLLPVSSITLEVVIYARDMEARHLSVSFTPEETADRIAKDAIIGFPKVEPM